MKSVFEMSVLSLALALNACSGGGGGDSSSNPGPSSSSTTTSTGDPGTSTGSNPATAANSGGGSAASGSGSNGGTGNGGVSDGTTAAGGSSAGTGTATGGNGTVGGATPADTPQNISKAPASNAEIAMDATGNAIAVWEQSDGTRDSVYYSRYTVGAGWGAPALLENLDVDAKQPAIAMNNAGNALAVWVQPNPNVTSQDYWTWARLYSPQTGWGPPTLVSNKTYKEYDGPWAATPHAAIDDSGIAIALWESSSLAASNVSLTGNVYRPESGWGTEQFLHRSWTTEPDIAMDGHGNAVVGYAHDGGGSYGAEPYAIDFSAASGWGTPHRFFTQNPGPQTSVAVGLDPIGNATAVWAKNEVAAYTSDRLPHQKIYYSRRSTSGDWSEPLLLASAAPYPSEFDVAVASNGNAVLSWKEGENGAFTIRAARFENGAWQSPVTIAAGDKARVAMAGDGPYMTLLQNNRAMYARYVGPGWSAPAPLDSGAEAASMPRIAGSTFSTPFFAWLQPSGVWARSLP